MKIFGLAQWPMQFEVDKPFSKFGFIAAATWQDAQAAAHEHWGYDFTERLPDGTLAGHKNAAYELSGLLNNLHHWKVDLKLLDKTLPATAAPNAAYCPHCGQKHDFVPDDCILKGIP